MSAITIGLIVVAALLFPLLVIFVWSGIDAWGQRCGHGDPLMAFIDWCDAFWRRRFK